MKDYAHIKIRISNRTRIGSNYDLLGYCEQKPGLRCRNKHYQICLAKEERYEVLAHELAHLCMLLLADNASHNSQFTELEKLLLTLKGVEKDAIKKVLEDY